MNNILLICGASSDIGIELIQSITENCLILAHYHSSEERLKSISGKIANQLVAIKADFTSEPDIRSFVEKIGKDHGFPDKIVYLPAPKFSYIRFKDLSWDAMEKEIALGLKPLTLLLHEFLPIMSKAKRGKIVCMLSSVTLNIPPKALAHYTAAKYAMLGLVKSLAAEYADKGITVNALSPSMIETNYLSEINPKHIEISAASHPLKRNAVPADIVPAIKFLLSSESDFINGVNIPITGGSIF